MAKGSAFEREISVALSRWWTEGERDDVFWRTSASGGRATARRKHGKDTQGQGGDIACTDPIGKPLIDRFNIELKTGYAVKGKVKGGIRITNWCLLDALDGRGVPQFLKMWRQCVRDAERTNRVPMLIFRRQQKSPCLCIPHKAFREIEDWMGHPTMFPMVRFYERAGGEGIIVMSLKNFFQWADLATILMTDKGATHPGRELREWFKKEFKEHK